MAVQHSPLLQTILEHVSEDDKNQLLNLLRESRDGARSASHESSTSADSVLPFPKRVRDLGKIGSFRTLGSEIAAEAALFDQERRRSLERVGRLDDSTEGERAKLVESDESLHTLAVCETLLKRARQRSFTSPTKGEELARLSLLLSQRLDPSHYGEGVVSGVTARAWAEVANTRRLAGDLIGAEALIVRARAFLDPAEHFLEEAQIDDLEASLKKDQRQFQEALALRRRAAAKYRRLGQKHLEGRVLVNEAADYVEMNEPERICAAVRKATPLLDPNLDLRAHVAVRHNLATALVDLGELDEADAVLSEILSLYPQVGDDAPRNLTRLRGRLAYRRGQLHQAEALLLDLQRDLRRQGLWYDLALVSLELAMVYYEQGRTEAVKDLARGLVPAFQARNVHRETLAALKLFEHAVQSETLSLGMLEEILAKLNRAPGQR